MSDWSMPPAPQPVGAFDDATRQWVLMDDWSCQVSPYVRLAVDSGATSDGASIPRFLWSAVGPQYAPDTFPAAFAHDMLYAAQLTERETADRIFRDQLLARGASKRRACGYWLAVRVFGGFLWDMHTPGQIAQAQSQIRLEAIV